MCDRGTWNLVCKEYPYGLIYKKNFKFLGRTVSEKNAMLTCNFKLSLWKFVSFSRKVCDRETWNFFCKEYPYGLIYKKNFKFLGRTVSEKSAMLISSYHRIFLEKCATPNFCKHEIFLQRVSIWVNMKKKISSSSVAQYRRKMRCYLVKFQSCLLGQLCNFEFLQVIIAFFSKSVRPRNMKFGLQRVSIWVNIQKKFQVPRSHSIGEKCDANL